MSNIYKVVFRRNALRSFERLDPALQRQLARKLEERRAHPEVIGDRLRKLPNCYKIKLRARGVRLIYTVRRQQLVILVLSVGARDGEEAYLKAEAELKTLDD